MARQYILEHGVATLTLRPLAEGIGVTIATVIRQFGSKDALLEAVVTDINATLVDDMRTDPRLRDQTPHDLLHALWKQWLHEPARRREFAVCFELYGLAIAAPQNYQWFFDSVVADWLAIIEGRLDGLPLAAEDKSALATAILGLIRGLHLDLIATGDTERVDRAFNLAMSALVRHAPRLPAAGR
jgi:AcrR family transcriptional regulator